MVSVRVLTDLRGGLTAVGRAEQRRVLHVDDVLVAGVAEHVCVVKSALTNRARSVDQFPRRTRIVRYEEATVLILDQRVDAVRVGLGVGDANAADHAGGHAGIARDVGPCLATVGGLIEPAAGTAARHLVLDAIRLPQGGIQDIGIVRVNHDVDGAGLGVLEQRAPPGLAAVAALEYATFLTGAVVKAETGDVDDLGVGRMDADFGKGVRVPEADIGPLLSAVCRFVDAVAGHDIAADARLAHADVDDVRVRVGNRDGADRGAGDLAVSDRGPVVAGVGRLPQAATNRAEVGLARPSLDAGNRNRAATAVGTDAAPAIGLKQGRIDGRRLRRRGCGQAVEVPGERQGAQGCTREKQP